MGFANSSFRRFTAITFIGLLGIHIGAVAAAAKSQPLGEFKQWSAHEIREGRAKTCYAHGEPLKKTGKYKTRGRTFVQVTHRPAEGTWNEVGITAGYSYRRDSEAIVIVDKKRFVLFTDKDTAWAKDSRQDRKLVRAFKKGRTMTVRATSSRGTVTIDTYSLSCFTRAYQAMGRACKRR
jgi:hypothetical protein